jgi:Cof subfamily protein (haloacid dehalogenase superfamily)
VTARVRLLVSDVDGTLVTARKVLTDGAVQAVRRLDDAGIAFAVTSGRPPRGMAMLVAPLSITTPIAGFNGGLLVRPDLTPMTQRTVPADVVAPLVALLESHGLAAWTYPGTDWLVRDPGGAHVAQEAATVEFDPTVRDDLETVTDGVVKVVGVSDEATAVDAATTAVRERFGDGVSASTSQPYYLDVTHPDANKGHVVDDLCALLDVDHGDVATIGDMPNDVLMFARSGVSIAMGNADRGVQRCARHVTTSNDDEGFARAVDRFVLGG